MMTNLPTPHRYPDGHSERVTLDPAPARNLAARDAEVVRSPGKPERPQDAGARRPLLAWLAAAILALLPAAAAEAQGTAFTYQGRLTDNGTPAEGVYDLRFVLYDAPVGGAQVGPILAPEDVAVTSGLFTVSLDFGASAFTGGARWLEIGVRPGASVGAYTTLGSRQELTPSPHSVFSATAASANAAPWSGLTGVPAGFADGVDNDSGGDITAVTAGTGLTGGGASGAVTLSANFGGGGGATTVSRSDHDHFGGSWSGALANGLTISTSNGGAGRAIYGEATATAGTNWGVWGQTASSEGRGVYGRATTTTGNNYGVFGESASATGTAVFGLSTGTAGLNYGVRGETASIQGRGVYGLATAATGTTYGVYGESSTFDGAGVQGVGQQYGVVGQTTNSTGFGFYTTNRGSFGAINVTGEVSGLTPSFLESQDVAVVIVNRRGSDGRLVNFAQSGSVQGSISVLGGVVSYNAFTGSHYAWTEADIEQGMLACLSGENRRLHGSPEGEVIYGVSVCSRPNDPAVLGAYLGRLEPGQADEAMTENPHLVAAVGNGEIWVLDTGEDLAPGDFLVSSQVPGHAMKDGDDLSVSHVVARVAQPVRWDDVHETVGDVRRARVSVLFDTGPRDKTVDVRRQLAAQGEEISRLKTVLDALARRMGPGPGEPERK